MDIRRHGVTPGETRKTGGLVNISLFVENSARRIRSRGDFRGADVDPGVIPFEAGTAHLVSVAQGEELASSEVVLEVLFVLFVTVNLHVADGEVIPV